MVYVILLKTVKSPAFLLLHTKIFYSYSAANEELKKYSSEYCVRAGTIVEFSETNTQDVIEKSLKFTF